MVDMMSVKDCPSIRNPLVVTVNCALVDTLLLASEGSPNNLKTVKFTQEAVLLKLLVPLFQHKDSFSLCVQYFVVMTKYALGQVGGPFNGM
jgi:hypothetical protein